MSLKTTQEDKGEKEEANASPAAAKEISVDATVVAVFIRTGHIFKLLINKERRRKLFSVGKMFLLYSWLTLVGV